MEGRKRKTKKLKLQKGENAPARWHNFFSLDHMVSLVLSLNIQMCSPSNIAAVVEYDDEDDADGMEVENGNKNIYSKIKSFSFNVTTGDSISHHEKNRCCF